MSDEENIGDDSQLDDVPEVDAGESEVQEPQSVETDATPAESPYSQFKQLPGFEDVPDSEIPNRLMEAVQREQEAYRALQQYQSIVPVASEYLQNRPDYEQWKASRTQTQAPQPQQAPAPEETSWWSPPPVKDINKQYLVRDAEGREIIAENAPLDARHELANYQAYKADFARRFLDDPQGALGPMVEKIVAQRASEIAQQQVGHLKDETLVKTLEEQNRDWLFDEQGNVSREGLLAQKYIEDARGKGIHGVQARWDYAVAMVERDLAIARFMHEQQQMAQAQQQPAAPAPVAEQPSQAEQNMEYLRRQASRAPTRRSSTGTDARKPKQAMSFEDRMLATLQQEGLAE